MESLYADIILLSNNVYLGTNKTIHYTKNSKPDFFIKDGGVAIKENKIIYAGSREITIRYADSNTKVYELGDNFISPGFHDDHVHLLEGCLYKKYPNLGEAKSEQEAVSILKYYYDKNPEVLKKHNWVLGFSWYNFWWDDKSYPTKESLDRYFKDVPVCLLNVDAHGVWLNSKALEICNIDKNTKDVESGNIIRDKDGNPTGFLEENACSLVIPTAFNFSEEYEKEIYKEYLPYCSKCGITSVNDMQPFFGKEIGNPKVFSELEDEGNLGIRINFATDLMNDIEYTKKIASKYSKGKVCHNGLKQFLDGVIVAHTSIMLDKYCDDISKNYRFPLSDLEKILEKVIEYQKEGFNIHLHATGDGAVRYALDCYEAAIKENGQTKSRMSVEHCDLVDTSDIKRFEELGVVASIQPPHIACADSYKNSMYLKTIGREREKNLWAYKSILNKSAHLAIGTDYPVVDIDPRYVIYSGLERLFPDKTPKGGFNREQKLNVYDILHAYTYGGAYMDGKEDLLGTLEKGKLADIVVLDKNILDIKSEDILKTNVVMTICDGKVTYKQRKEQ